MRNKKQQSVSVSSPMDTALKYLTGRARTVREVEYHLDSCHYAEYDVYATVERLKELDYLNDAKYAKEFIETRLATKPISKRRLFEQLLKHEIDTDIIKEALLLIDDETEQNNAIATAEKFYAQFADRDEKQRKDRTASRLKSRGYDYSTIRIAMEKVSNSVEFNIDDSSEDYYE